ncbi:Alpha/Beta hydrolase protein [Xylariales sp. PMI_506]|nr:Alpha/Beta hydrolase protein [Xylariales sp. PMI_506]
MANLKYDPEFWEVIKPFADIEKPDFDDPITLRKVADGMFAERFSGMPPATNVEVTEHEVTSADGAKIPVYRHLPSTVKDATEPQPAAIYVHGGGLIAGSAKLLRPLIENTYAQHGVQLFAVEYRLAPEHPFPKPMEDVYATLEWLQSNAQSFNVDPERIALFGSSAGGGIATGTAFLARDRKLSPPPARLILLYPMLDDRTTRSLEDPASKYYSWPVKSNDMGWKAYLGGRDREQRGDDVPIYAAPGRAENVEGLPPTYIDIGGFDLFLGESIEFAGKLVKANVQVEFHLYPGVPHGWEGTAPNIRTSKEAKINRARVLNDF